MGNGRGSQGCLIGSTKVVTQIDKGKYDTPSIADENFYAIANRLSNLLDKTEKEKPFGELKHPDEILPIRSGYLNRDGSGYSYVYPIFKFKYITLPDIPLIEIKVMITIEGAESGTSQSSPKENERTLVTTIFHPFQKQVEGAKDQPIKVVPACVLQSEDNIVVYGLDKPRLGNVIDTKYLPSSENHEIYGLVLGHRDYAQNTWERLSTKPAQAPRLLRYINSLDLSKKKSKDLRLYELIATDALVEDFKEFVRESGDDGLNGLKNEEHYFFTNDVLTGSKNIQENLFLNMRTGFDIGKLAEDSIL